MFQHFSAEKTDSGLDFDIEVEPGKRVYCFFGRNGAGKTSMLENLGRTLLLAHTMLAGPNTHPRVRGWPNSPVQTTSPPRFEGLFRGAEVHPMLGQLQLTPPAKTSLNNTNGVNLTGGHKAVPVALDDWTSERRHVRNVFVDQPVVAISAMKRGFTDSLSADRIKLLGSHATRFVQSYVRTYNAVTRQQVETESLAEWLAARLIVNPAFARSDDRSFEVATMLHLMEELDPKLFAGLSTRTTDGSFPAIHYSDGRLWLGETPLDKLPSGFLAIMKLFQEILGGFAGWTAFQDVKDLGAVDGIVLIDEIEAHLHPTWQAKIVPLLKRFFPQATFYLCTHSPLIVATTDDGEAYELVREDQRVTAHKLGNPRAWYMADVYEQAFHVELPGADEAESVPDLLLDFSLKVKDHLRTKDATLADQAKALYDRLVPSIPSTDPRRASLDALRKMVA